MELKDYLKQLSCDLTETLEENEIEVVFHSPISLDSVKNQIKNYYLSENYSLVEKNDKEVFSSGKLEVVVLVHQLSENKYSVRVNCYGEFNFRER